MIFASACYGCLTHGWKDRQDLCDCGSGKLWRMCFWHHRFLVSEMQLVSLIAFLIYPFPHNLSEQSQSSFFFFFHRVRGKIFGPQNVGSWTAGMKWFETGDWGNVEEKGEVVLSKQKKKKGGGEGERRKQMMKTWEFKT